MLKWCSLHTVNLGVANWVVGSAILELLAMVVTSLRQQVFVCMLIYRDIMSRNS